MLAVGLEPHQVHDVDHADPQIREQPAQDRRGRDGLKGRDVARARENHVGFAPAVIGGPLPDPDPAGAVGDRVVDREVGEGGLLAGDDHVDVVVAAQAVVGDRQQTVGVGRKVDPDDLRLLVDDVIDEARDPGARSRCGPDARHGSRAGS